VDLVATLISQAPLAAGALLIVYLLLTGKIVTGKEFTRVTAERDEYKQALTLERQAMNETAQAASVTNRLIGAVVDLAADRQGVPRHPLSPAEENGP
jgi:hypothetical protein